MKKAFQTIILFIAAFVAVLFFLYALSDLESAVKRPAKSSSVERGAD